VFIVLAAAVGVAGTHFSDSNRLPASASSTAYRLLAKAGSNTASAKTGTIVWHTRTGSATGQPARVSMTRMLQRVSGVSGVESVLSPFTASGRRDVSEDGRTAYATVVFSSTSHVD
jgi:putative drug exporter of the RND superfamily